MAEGIARHRSAVAAAVAGMVVGQHAVAVCLPRAAGAMAAAADGLFVK